MLEKMLVNDRAITRAGLAKNVEAEPAPAGSTFTPTLHITRPLAGGPAPDRHEPEHCTGLVSIVLARQHGATLPNKSGPLIPLAPTTIAGIMTRTNICVD